MFSLCRNEEPTNSEKAVTGIARGENGALTHQHVTILPPKDFRLSPEAVTRHIEGAAPLPLTLSLVLVIAAGNICFPSLVCFSCVSCHG